MTNAPRTLRRWQSEALQQFLSTPAKDFLAVATPGAGKTTFALSAATFLLQQGDVDQIVVVAPTEHLKQQWADAAAKFGIALDPRWSNSSKLAPGYMGVVVTYAQVSLDPERHHGGVSARKTFVILDEVHHAGDSLSWGDGVKTAYRDAVRRLSLSGSPWRSDQNPIPFISYQAEHGGTKRSRADYTYGYGEALRDGVVRPIVFFAYSGQARWRTGAGTDLEAALDGVADKVTTGRAWRTALDPQGEWIAQVLAAADNRLTQVRSSGMHDAGGLVLASNQTHAKAYAKALEALCGEKTTIVLSDETGSSDKIEEFAAGSSRWMVAVRMVSEGVDVPRLAVGVYATNSSTSLFFTQAIGRFVRSRSPEETATLFVPSVPVLQQLAGDIETERDHVLGSLTKDNDGLDDALLARANRSDNSATLEEKTFEAIEATAHLDRVIYNGSDYGPSAHQRDGAESDLLTLPGVLSPEQVQAILADRAELYATGTDQADDTDLPLHRRMYAARKDLAREVALHAQATGESHAQIHTQLRELCGGPAVSEATLDQVKARTRRLQRWFDRPTPTALPQQEDRGVEVLTLF